MQPIILLTLALLAVSLVPIFSALQRRPVAHDVRVRHANHHFTVQSVVEELGRMVGQFNGTPIFDSVVLDISCYASNHRAELLRGHVRLRFDGVLSHAADLAERTPNPGLAWADRGVLYTYSGPVYPVRH